jgi:transposase-like protein
MAKPGPLKIKNYGIEFKLRAVQLSSQPGVLVKDVAESLCIVSGHLTASFNGEPERGCYVSM